MNPLPNTPPYFLNTPSNSPYDQYILVYPPICLDSSDDELPEICAPLGNEDSEETFSLNDDELDETYAKKSQSIGIPGKRIVDPDYQKSWYNLYFED